MYSQGLLSAWLFGSLGFAWDHACVHMSLLSWALLSSVSDVACLCCWMLRLLLLLMLRQ